MGRLGRSRTGRPRAGGWRLATAVVGLIGLAGCTAPEQFHVAKSDEPRFEDKDVRFRTVYYFRVYDQCADGDLGMGRNAGQDVFGQLRGRPRILKDSIYRFRMTGKASEVFAKVHFEAGTLKSYQIDPFGADVGFDDTNRRFYLRTQDETQADARHSAVLRRIRQYEDAKAGLAPTSALGAEYDALILSAIRSLGDGAPPALAGVVADRLGRASLDAQDAAIRARAAASRAEGKSAADIAKDTQPLMDKRTLHDDVRSKLRADLIRLLDVTSRAAHDAVGDAKAALDVADKKVTDADTAAKVAGLSADQLKAAQENLKEVTRHRDDAQVQYAIALARRDEIRRIGNGEFLGSSQAAAPSSAAEGCGTGSATRRGFQILGPEGLRTFNQDERLIMAMSSDGSPLISLLQELSGRILTPKVTEAEQLLPLAVERNRLSESRQALEGQPDSLETANKSIDAAIAKLKLEKEAGR